MTANPIGDEEVLYFDTPEFQYAGESYSRIGIDSNGYLIVGGGTGTSQDNQCCPPQTLPDPAPPNNVLAPFWSDLDGTGAPGVFVGLLTDNVDSWVVVEWRVNEFGTTTRKVFQTWIGVNGTEDISYTYDPGNLPTTPTAEALTVGAENSDGSAGAHIDGAPTGDLRVASVGGNDGGSVTYSFKVRGVTPGRGQVLTTLGSPSVAGRTLEWDDITVNRR